MRGRLAELDVETADGILVARISGEIDSSNAGELRLALLEGLTNSGRGMVLDLTEASYVDSTGIALVFELARGLESRRQGLRLAVPVDGPVRRVLELSAIESVAQLDHDAATSIEALRND